MNILLLTPFLPDPDAPAGCPRAVYDRLRLLGGEHAVTVICFLTQEEAGRLARVPSSPAQILGVPRPAPATGFRHRLGKWIRLASALPRLHRPLLVQEFASQGFRSQLRAALASASWDLVLVEHILMAQYLSDVPADVPVIVSDHDVRLAWPDSSGNDVGGPGISGSPAARGVRRRLGSPPPIVVVRSAFAAYERGRWRRYARLAYRRAATVLVPTVLDADWLDARLPGLRPAVAGFGSAGSEIPHPPALRRQETLLFVGNFSHPPNRDAAHFLVEDILPRVRQSRPETRVWLVGHEPTPDVTALAGVGVLVTGHVPSVRCYLNACTVFVAPLRQGGGMRMKTLEALDAGVPVITTILGAAGLDARPGRDLLIADTSASFATQILAVLADPVLRDQLGTAGRAIGVGDHESRRRQLAAALARI